MTEDNRNTPPRSGLKTPPREPGSILKAVLLGAATDIGGTILFGLIVGIVYGIVLAAQGLSIEEIQLAMQHIDPWSPMGVLNSGLGLAMSVAGGYVCAYTSNRNSYTPIGILSAISVAIGTVSGMDTYEWQTLLALNLTGLVAIFVGGWLYIRKLHVQ